MYAGNELRIFTFHSLHYWRPQVGWYRVLCQRRSCGGMQQWSMGYCVWWFLVQRRCKSSLCTTGFLSEQ